MDVNYLLGKRIKGLRLANNMTVEYLAEKLGISATHMKHVESANRNLSSEKLFKLCRILNLSLDEVLFNYTGSNKACYDATVNLLSDCSDYQLNTISAFIKIFKSIKQI